MTPADAAFALFVGLLLTTVILIAANALFVSSLRQSVAQSLGAQLDVVQGEMRQYRTAAEGAMAALTGRCERQDAIAGQLEETQRDVTRALDGMTGLLDRHLAQTDARTELVRALREEVQYLRRIAFADNEYIKAVEHPNAQGAVAGQVRRENEPAAIPGRPAIRTIRHRIEGEIPPPRPRTRIPIEGTETGPLPGADGTPWGVEPGRAPVKESLTAGIDLEEVDREAAKAGQ